MNKQLTEHLIRAGLLQFGNFDRVPFRFNFHLLPSYPTVLSELCEAISSQITNENIERLVCTADTLPVSLGVSQRKQIPLVYSRGSTDAPVFDLVGAYDVGHPTIMITSIVMNSENLNTFIKRAGSVGLSIQMVHTLVDLRTSSDSSEDVIINSLFNFEGVMDDLVKQGHLPPHQMETIKKWLADH